MTKSDLSKTIISFLGPPGAGKGTIARRAINELNFQSLSTGDLCRQHIAQKTDFGNMLNDYLSRGELIPDQLITDMVNNWLKVAVKLNMPIILDGYPRTENQAKLFYNLLKKSFPDYKFRIIEINLLQDDIIKRLSGRLVCKNENCQAVYNKSMFSEKDEKICKQCGSKLVSRPDDQKSVVKARLSIYERTHASLVNYYKSVNQEIEILDVGGLSEDEVFDKFKALLYKTPH